MPVTSEQVATAVARVASRDDVLLAELALPRGAEASAVPNDPHFSQRGSWGQRHADQWALHRIGFTPLGGQRESAWPANLETQRYVLPRTTVAVIGSGVDYTHPELLGRMWVNEREIRNGKDDDGNGYVDDVFGWNFRDDSSDVMDYGGHDTHVAGVIAARWHSDRGIAGINPMACIMALKVADLFGNTDSAAISQAILYAVDHGARVINLSYGGDQLSQAERLAIDYAAERGVLVVAAAGNQAVDNTSRGLAGASGVLTVATTAVEGDRAGFSNWGQAVEIAAPGLDILSLRARDTDFLLYVGDNESYRSGQAIVGEDGELYRAGGTSFSAPLVCGVASLLWSIDPGLTADQVRRKLIMSADDIDVPGWDQNTGAGLLNARAALAADPDQYLVARLTSVAPGPRVDGVPSVDVAGAVRGSGQVHVRVQIALGEDPADDEWRTVFETDGEAAGVIHRIPATEFNRPGTWTVRLRVNDENDAVSQSRARLTLE